MAFCDTGTWKGKTTSNILSIELLNQKLVHEMFGSKIPAKSDKKPLVCIIFKFPCKYTTLTIHELLTIIEKWIRAEQIRYPNIPSKNEFLKREINKIFSNI